MLLLCLIERLLVCDSSMTAQDAHEDYNVFGVNYGHDNKVITIKER